MGNNLSQKARDQIRAAQKEGSTELILRDCQLKGVPSSLAKKLKHLKTLILSRNYIPALPPKVVHFTELETLNLDDNQLAGFPVQILDLPKLKNLSIARNNILQLPDDFGSKLNQLEKLDITGNHIAALSPDFHKLGATLIEFSFGAAGLTQVPSAVFQLVRLKSLDLSANKFASLPEELTNIAMLEVLKFENTPITAMPLFLPKFAKLQSINAAGNNFGDMDTYPFGDISVTLRELNLSGCRITRISGTIGSLTNLEVLDLSSNMLKSVPKEIGHIGMALGKLFLNENQLEKVPGELGMLDPAMKLELRGNPLKPPFDAAAESTIALFDAILPYCSAWGPNCEVKGEAVNTALRGRGVSFKIIAKDFKNRARVSGGDNLEAYMIKESESDVVPVDVIIKDLKDGTYDVFYNATQPGDYKLHLSCERKPFKGSPFPVTVFEM